MEKLLEIMGEQITWEFLKCEDRWYVCASNNPREEYGFKFSSAHKSLDMAVRMVVVDLALDGPDWVRTGDTTKDEGI